MPSATFSFLVASTCDLFRSFKFHTHTLLSSHSLCLCKKNLSSMTSSYVIAFSLTKAWILLSLFSLSQRFLFSKRFFPQHHFMVVTLSFCSPPACAPPYLNRLSPFLAALHMTLFLCPLPFSCCLFSMQQFCLVLFFDFSSSHSCFHHILH